MALKFFQLLGAISASREYYPGVGVALTVYKFTIKLFTMSGGFGRRKTPQQIEQELLKAVEEAKRLYDRSTGEARDAARQRYEVALKRFNQFVVIGELPSD